MKVKIISETSLAKASASYQSYTSVFLFTLVLLLSSGESYNIKEIIQNFETTNLNLIPGRNTTEITIQNLYTFNITNPDEVEAGEKPILQECGPYVFKVITTKYNIEAVNESVTFYRSRQTFHFHPELSNGSYSDIFNILNFPFVVFANHLSSLNLPPAFNNILMEELEENGESLVRRNVTWEEMHWTGFNVSAYTAILSDFGEIPSELEGDVFYLFRSINESVNEWTVRTRGPDIGYILTMNGESKVNYWIGDKCNRIHGTDGRYFQPGSLKVSAFLKDMCRNVEFVKVQQGQQEMDGIPLDAFTFAQDLFDNGYTNKDHLCYCSLSFNETEPTCLKPGVLDVSGCTKGGNFATALPHFMDADPSYVQHIGCCLKPDRKKHQSVFLVEPRTGIVVSSAIRLQVNMNLKAYPNIAYFQNISEKVFPLGWGSWEYKASPDIVAQLRNLAITFQEKELYDHDATGSKANEREDLDKNTILERTTSLNDSNSNTKGRNLKMYQTNSQGSPSTFNYYLYIMFNIAIVILNSFL